MLSNSGLTSLLSTAIYIALGLLALWGAYCVIVVWRRVAQTRFRTEAQQAEFLDVLDKSLAQGKFKEVVQQCEDDRRAVPQLVLLALANRGIGLTKLRQQVVERFQRDVLADIEYRLSWVQTIIKSAPMVGLLGTVVGMMGAFGKIAGEERVEPKALAADINIALYTTACGLAIAVPLVLCTASVNIRIRQLEDLVGQALTRIFDTLRTVSGTQPEGKD